MAIFTTSTGLDTFRADKRVNYSLGMIVGADDMAQDQRYLTARDEQHQRTLHGWGVTSGLELDFDGEELRVKPGLAVDAEGRTICVETAQCADVLGWLNSLDDVTLTAEGITVHVLLCWAECATDALPVPSGPCQSLDDSLVASRVTNSFELQLTLVEPGRTNDRGNPRFAPTIEALMDEDAELDDKRAALHDFIANRGVTPAFADACLTREGQPCVPLGAAALSVERDGDAIVWRDAPTDDIVDMRNRPAMVSTSFLQEWLLRVQGGGTLETVPDLSVMELNDTATAGTPPNTDPPAGSAPDHSVLRYDASLSANGLWIAEELNLGLLDDVDIESTPPDDDVYLGLNRVTGQWEARVVDHPEPDDPVDGPEPTLLGLPDTAVIDNGNPETDIQPSDIDESAVLAWERRHELFMARQLDLNDLGNVAGSPDQNQVLTFTGNGWRPRTPTASAPPGHKVLARRDQPIAIVAAGVLDLQRVDGGRDRGDWRGQVSGKTYGGLRLTDSLPLVDISGAGVVGGVAAVTFDGMEKLADGFGPTVPQLVVQVTPESRDRMASAQVAAMGLAGIALWFRLEALDAPDAMDGLKAFLENFDVDPDREANNLRLHIEVLLYEDDETGERFFEEVRELELDES